MLNWRPVRDTEQLQQENARFRQLNARARELLFSAAQLCSPPDSFGSRQARIETLGPMLLLTRSLGVVAQHRP